MDISSRMLLRKLVENTHSLNSLFFIITKYAMSCSSSIDVQFMLLGHSCLLLCWRYIVTDGNNSDM